MHTRYLYESIVAMRACFLIVAIVFVADSHHVLFTYTCTHILSTTSANVFVYVFANGVSNVSLLQEMTLPQCLILTPMVYRRYM